MKHAVLLALIGSLWLAFAGETRAEGALAIGKCDRFGFDVNNKARAAAEEKAMAECGKDGDKGCKVVLRLSRRGCMAFATESDGCGARGWASAASRDEAEKRAIAFCKKNGGGDTCVIKGQACEATPAASTEKPAK
jgi:hypothetical protein